MGKVTIKRDRCKGCLLCVRVCPSSSLEESPELNKRGVHPVRHKQGASCSGCAQCAWICPDTCIEVER